MILSIEFEKFFEREGRNLKVLGSGSARPPRSLRLPLVVGEHGELGWGKNTNRWCVLQFFRYNWSADELGEGFGRRNVIDLRATEREK